MYPLLALVTLICATLWLRRRTQRYPYPPGPPGNLIFGNMWKLPTTTFEETFHEWAQKYGDVMSIRLPGRRLIIINSDEAANDLLHRTSSKFSSRPPFPVYELMGWHYATAHTPYGKDFVGQRKQLNQYLHRKRTEEYYPIQLKEARNVLRSLLANPTYLEDALARFSAAVIIKIDYGLDVTSIDDPLIQAVRVAEKTLNYGATAGLTALDLFPLVKYFPSWLPGTFYVNMASRVRHQVKRFYDLPYETVRGRMEQGLAEPSLLTSCMSSLDEARTKDDDSVLRMKAISSIFFVGGFDTTSSTLGIWFLCMIQNPEVAKRAQKEIDEVVGSDRLPDFSDRHRLPYLDCVIQEVLRWYPILQSSIPHYSTEDHIYKGMFIPKGSVVYSNSRGITLDERVYRDPRRFYPERYLPKPQGYGEPYCACVFGYGRRICPGRHLALNSLWIATASLLAAFDISKAVGEDGKEIEPKAEFSLGMIHHLKPFPYQLKPRSSRAAELVMEN